jgi:hypothetical protein
MALDAIYDTEDKIPEAFRELYTEKNGKFELTGINGVKTQADIDRLQTSLTKERDAHKTSKSQLEQYASLGKLEDLQAALDKLPELEAAAAGKLDDAKLNELVDGRLKSKTAPLERERAQLQTQLQEAQTKIAEYEQLNRQRKIHDAVRAAATDSKLHEHALDDALLLAERVFDVDEDGRVVTKDNVGVTPGVDPKVWLTEMQPKRPHWWPASSGGGAAGSNGRGGYGNNPFSAEHWNMTEQGHLLRENPERAKQMAASAGTTVGGPRPAPRKQ